MKCDICGNNESYIKEHKHNFERGNIKYSFTSNRRFCSNCDALVYDAILDNEASQKAIDTYTQIVGIAPESIIALRKKYNLSQEQFSKIIGCAKKTLISYEQGRSIPNEIYLVTLKTLLDNPDIISLLIDSNKERYSTKEFETINRKISDFYKNNNKLTLNEKETEPTEFNGYTKLSPKKIKNIILLLSETGILKTKLLKEMFYIDFLSYKESGCSITGLEYAKCPYGPVPDEFDKIINTFVLDKSLKYEIEYGDTGYEYHNISSLTKPNNKVFTDKELNIINKVKEYFKNFNTKRIVERTHKEKAFLETEMFKLIDYSYAFDIELK